MNIKRQEIRRAGSMLYALKTATKGFAGKEFFEAHADDDAEAEAMFQKFKADYEAANRE